MKWQVNCTCFSTSQHVKMALYLFRNKFNTRYVLCFAATTASHSFIIVVDCATSDCKHEAPHLLVMFTLVVTSCQLTPTHVAHH